jgi:serine carboxypeptidase-like clade 4
MLDQLMWGKEAAWAAAKSLPWKVKGAQAGVLRQAGPLAMARFNRAGHIVPRDMPAASLELLKRWLGGRPLYS